MKGLLKRLGIAFAFAFGFLVVGTAGVKAAEVQRVDNGRMAAFIENGRVLTDSRGQYIEVPSFDDLKVSLQFKNYADNPTNGSCGSTDCSSIFVEVFIQKLGSEQKYYKTAEIAQDAQARFRKPVDYNLVGLLADQSTKTGVVTIDGLAQALTDLQVAGGNDYANTYVVVVKSYVKTYSILPWDWGWHYSQEDYATFRLTVASERGHVVDGMTFYLTSDNKVVVKSPETLTKFEYYVTDTKPSTENFDEAKAGQTVKNVTVLTPTSEGALYVYTLTVEGLTQDNYIHVHALSATKDASDVLTNKVATKTDGWAITVPQILLIVLLGILVVVAAAVIIQKIVDHRRKLY